MQESQRIAIAFTVNDSYAQHCCVAMASALENNKSEFLDIYIFTDYFSDRNRQLFEQTVRRYGDGNRLSFIIVEDSALKKLRLNISYITHHTTVASLRVPSPTNCTKNQTSLVVLST